MTMSERLQSVRKLEDPGSELTLSDRHRLADFVRDLFDGKPLTTAAGLHWRWRRDAELARRDAALLALADLESPGAGLKKKAELIERALIQYRLGRWRHDYAKGPGAIPEHEARRRLWFTVLEADASRVRKASRIRRILRAEMAKRGQSCPEVMATVSCDSVSQSMNRPRTAALLKTTA